mmetsp:Transcript_978/g.2364  ORF Transcript_978/g.2364 Transcript_978/m.2364 type:complete len:217 (+) Transcript_978:265-915(+)
MCRCPSRPSPKRVFPVARRQNQRHQRPCCCRAAAAAAAPAAVRAPRRRTARARPGTPPPSACRSPTPGAVCRGRRAMRTPAAADAPQPRPWPAGAPPWPSAARTRCAGASDSCLLPGRPRGRTRPARCVPGDLHHNCCQQLLAPSRRMRLRRGATSRRLGALRPRGGSSAPASRAGRAPCAHAALPRRRSREPPRWRGSAAGRPSAPRRACGRAAH